jgi:hypothetical protein
MLCCRRLTPTLTPTPVNVDERLDTLGQQNARFQSGTRTSLNAAEQMAVGSNAASVWVLPS